MSNEIPQNDMFMKGIAGKQVANSGQAANEAVQSKPNSIMTAGAEKRGVKEFKEYDKDGDLKISEEEFLNKFVKEYVDNGYNLVGPHTQGETIADLLSFLKEKFQKFASDDNQLNIDEYLSMVKDRLEQKEAAGKTDSLKKNTNIQADEQKNIEPNKKTDIKNK